MIKVYHKIDSDFFTAAKKYVTDEFKLVGEVDTNDLDVAYRLTNTIECGWWENEGVKCFPGKARSTSIGDVLLTEDGRFMAVAICGFAEIPAEVGQHLQESEPI